MILAFAMMRGACRKVALGGGAEPEAQDTDAQAHQGAPNGQRQNPRAAMKSVTLPGTPASAATCIP